MNTTSTAPAGNYALVNGIQMYYEIAGAGQPLVLIHGGGSTIDSNFGAILPTLAGSRMVIAVELQAHGRTADRDAPETFEQDADDVAALLRQLGIAKADVLGFSNGGNTAMRLATRHEQLVRRMVIASAFYKKDGIHHEFWEGMAKATFADMPKVYVDAYLAVNDSQTGVQNMFARDSERMKNFSDWADEDLTAIKAETLVVMADRDVMTVEHGVKMHRLIPGSRLAILPGTHGSYMAEAMTRNTGDNTAVQFLGLIQAFMDAP